MTPKEIIALSPTEALALHARGLGGDDVAVADYVRWATWKQIDKKKELSPAKKLKAFLAFSKCFTVVVSRG